QDAIQINQILEQMIRLHPEQYLWQHRRFKTRPEGQASVY
ncbi:MAG: lipid A biosynthesis acyltransferase, partial [Gammaproteobacteria bacterium]